MPVTKKIPYNVDGDIYTPAEIRDVLFKSCNHKNLFGNARKLYYYNIPAAFDIETTSFYRDATGTQYSVEQVQAFDRLQAAGLEKCACMYVWQFGINGNVVIGRTWDEFVACMQTVAETLGLDVESRRLIVYVHNLSYEFQFIRRWFEWNKVFSIDLRKPIYAITTTGIEFRCSYLLSGYSLAKIGEQLQRYPVKKLTGDLDYSLIRHAATPLTYREIGYCVNDVKVVMSYIQETIENCKGITNVPLTKTGFVRKYCRKNCLYRQGDKGRQQNFDYADNIRSMTIHDLNEFDALQRAFAGGFTHANAYYTGRVLQDVASYDFTSSYPYVMISEKYPMSSPVQVQPKTPVEFATYCRRYCCVFDIEFVNLYTKRTNETPLSVSKCFVRDNVVENNGRVFSASRVATTITNIDYDVLRAFYRWDVARIGNMYVYRKEYLPTEFVSSILDLYRDKTTLKGVAGKEIEYLNSKEMLNSCYGMSVTNPLRDEFTYNGVWDVAALSNEDRDALLQQYNTSRNRFLYYPWGVFVTAYARRNLFTAILALGDDYVYSDTDSVKFVNLDKHRSYFDRYNDSVQEKLQAACTYHKIDFERCRPSTIKGVPKLLGVWDFEGVYTRFKTLGAKRYMIQKPAALTVDGVTYDYSLTVSGVNKYAAIPYLLQTYGESGIFDAFNDYLHLPPKATGKNIHTYIDYEQTGRITDYTGVTSTFAERSTVHLEPVDYTLSLSILYINYLRGIKLKQ